MTEIDAGHKYELLALDGEHELQTLTFMKRFDAEDPSKYPGNTDAYGGTNMQSVLRALISRTKYLDKQIHCHENTLIIQRLKECNWLLEQRAAHRHGKEFTLSIDDALELPMCSHCGHVICDHFPLLQGTR